MSDEADPAGTGDAEPPPFLGRWSRLYAIVIAALVVLIALLAWLTRHYA